MTLVALLVRGENVALVWLCASIGNTLGAVVNWYLGRYLTHFESRPWFPFKPGSMKKAEAWFQRYGKWSLLMAWLPIGGDALTFIAGVLRVQFWSFLLLVFIGKSLRYAVVIGLYFGLF